MADFIPAGDDARKTWAAAFRLKIGAHAPTLGLTAPAVQALHETCDNIIEFIDDKAAKKNAWQSSAAAARTGTAAAFTSLRSTIAAIKTNSAYTEAIGADLGIVGSADPFDPST